MSFVTPQHKIGTKDFSAGYLDTPEPDSLPPGSTPDALNALLINLESQDEKRAVQRKRPGSRLVNPTAMSSGATVDALYEFLRETAAGELLAVCNGVLKKYDNVNAFNAISGGTGFTAGNPTRLLSFKNNALVSDGNQNLRYDGTACYPVGFIAPTAAPGRAAGAGGLTGTFEGYVVWYDSTADHESSPSATSGSVALVAQGRAWTKPAGAPPANVDFWRTYVRRVDTNERNFYRTASTAIGTATFTEAISDAARTIPGPNPTDNDVPPAFALMEEYKGFRFGVKTNSSLLYVSAQYDAESQNPSNVFAIGGKGDGKPIQCVKKYGQECLIQKPRRTYRVIGSKIPFTFEPIHSSLGNVSQDAAIEVNGWYYAWDDIKGPYRTNLVQWQPLADGRVRNTVGSVNRLSLTQIRVEHVAAHTLIVWAVPTASSRKRTLFAYNYLLDRWLPPITGLEYSSLASFTTTAGQLGIYVGDYWGRVYELFSGELDGPPSGDTTGTITAATSGTITCSAAAFYAGGSGLAGMPAAVKSPAGLWQWVRVQSNTGTVLTLDTTNGAMLNPVPAAGWMVYVGAIEWYWWIPQLDCGNSDVAKVARWLTVQARMTSATTPLEVSFRLNGNIAVDTTFNLTFPVGGGLVWGSGTWGVNSWGSSASASKKHRLMRSFFQLQIRFQNFYPNQPVVVTSYSVGADDLVRRTVASA